MKEEDGQDWRRASLEGKKMRKGRRGRGWDRKMRAEWLLRELTPQSDPSFNHPYPLLLHTPFPLIFWSSIQISLLLQPFLFQCLKRSLLAPAPCLSPKQPPCFSALPSPPHPLRPPSPAHLQLSDGHDLLPSQFHLSQLQSGQLCRPVPALLGRTRGHPTGPGPDPGFPKPKRPQQPVAKEKQVLKEKKKTKQKKEKQGKTSPARAQQFCPASMESSLQPRLREGEASFPPPPPPNYVALIN